MAVATLPDFRSVQESMMCPFSMFCSDIFPDSKVHGAIMGPIWGRQDPDGPHVGPMNFAIRVTNSIPYIPAMPRNKLFSCMHSQAFCLDLACQLTAPGRLSIRLQQWV